MPPVDHTGGSSLGSKVNAAPFVPGASPQLKHSQSGTSLPESAVKAVPFVPAGSGSGNGSGKANSQGQAGGSGAGRTAAPAKLVATAAAFVPKQQADTTNRRGAVAPDASSSADTTPGAGSGRTGSSGATTASTQPPAPSPASGRGAAGRGGGRGVGSSGGVGLAPAAGPLQPGRAPMPAGRGGRGVPLGAASSSGPGAPSTMNPGPMPGRGGRGGMGGRGAGSPQYMGGNGAMHLHGNAMAMSSGFGSPMGPMGPMGPVPMAAYGAGGGGHLPAYRPRDMYLSGPGRAYVGLHFLEEGLRQQLQHRAFALAAQWHDEAADDSAPAAPYRLGPYHTLYPLEEGAMGAAVSGSGGTADMPSAALGLRTVLVKGISSVDASAAALRRIDPKQVIPTAELLSRAREAVESWVPLANHPNLVGLRAAFLASDSLSQPPQSGGGGGECGSALVFAHDFHPGAASLAAAHLVPQMNAAGLVSAPQPPAEEVVWSYAVQLTSALRAAHGCGLLLRPACLHPSKVLLTGFGRLRVGSVGIVDALMGAEQPGPDELQMLMRQDITAMGTLLLTLCCAGAGPAPSLDLVSAHYSPELVRLLGALLAAADGGPLGSWRGLVAALADRAFTDLDSAGVAMDNTVSELAKEAENGRLLRLLAKINFVTDRPAEGAAGQDAESSWPDAGDRYIVKLFRDFVFHGATPDVGAPLLDWGLVVEALNKLDAGVHEEVLLLGRDGQSMLVVTYADVKRCLEGAFADLRATSNTAASSTASGRGGQPARNLALRG